MSLYFAQIRREALLASRSRSDAATPLAFFALAVVLLGLGTGADAPPPAALGMIWVLALFANVLAVDGAFVHDHDDGTLEQLLIHARPRFAAVLGKLTAHWALSGLPVAVCSPLAAYLLTGATTGAGTLAASLLLGTPALTLIGAIGAALTTGIGRGGLLLAILVMPLYVPVLIFGASASVAAATGGDASFALRWLAVLLAAAITAAPFAIGKALDIGQDY